MKTMMRGALKAAGGGGRGSRMAEVARPRTPEPTGLGMTHISLEDDEEPRRQATPPPLHSAVDQLFERLGL